MILFFSRIQPKTLGMVSMAAGNKKTVFTCVRETRQACFEQKWTRTLHIGSWAMFLRCQTQSFFPPWKKTCMKWKHVSRGEQIPMANILISLKTKNKRPVNFSEASELSVIAKWSFMKHLIYIFCPLDGALCLKIKASALWTHNDSSMRTVY